MKLRLSSDAVASTEIRVTSFTDAFRSLTRALPSGILVFTYGPITNLGSLDTSILAGSSEVWVGVITTLTSTDRTEILTEAGAIFASSAIAFDDITKVGSRWQAVSSQIAPTNLAAVLSGDATRTTLSGLAEIIGYLLTSAGQSELGLPQAVIVDQSTEQMGFLTDATALTAASNLSYRGAIKEINTDTQDFLETY